MKTYRIRIATTHPGHNFVVTEDEITLTAESAKDALLSVRKMCGAWQCALETTLEETAP